MADIVLKYKGLTGTLTDITIDNGQTMAQLLTAIASDEGLTSSYYNISLYRDPSITEATSGTLASKSIITGDTIICTPDQSGNLEERQIQKLDIAAAKRGEAYDRDKLPTKYSTNTLVDNPNTGGLEQRRPWIIDFRAVTENLQLFFDPSDTDSYPGTGTTITNLATPTLSGTMSNITFNDPYFTYNGTDSQISIADNAALEPGSGDWTMEAWFRPTTVGSSMVVLGKFNNGGASQDVSYSIRINTTGVLFAQLGSGSGSGATLFVNSNNYQTTVNTWYHVVYVFKNIATNSLETYINGVSIGSVGHSLASILNSTNPLYIGRYNGGEYAQDFAGDIGIVRLYNGALTSAQVLQNYNANRGLYGL